MTFNQLKLNSNTVIDGLNLVNVVQRPQPIVIENVNRAGRRNHSPPTRDSDFRNSRSDFEVIDENKLTMYSYLVKREMKTKEWLSKFHLDYPNRSLVEENPNVKQPVAKTINEKKKRIMFNDESKKPNTAVSRKSPSRISRIGSDSKTNNELEDLKSCCDETIKSIEYLEQKLSEFKNERLKIVLNDPVEEEKQKRIQLGQLKHLSRVVYNSQIQLKKFKPQLKRSPSPPLSQPKSSTSTSKSLTPIGRLVHTMRLVNKSIHAFAEFYPYRPDNDIRSERLCYHFYKQAHLCVSNFNECLLNAIVFTNVIGENGRSTAKRLIELLGNCDQYFEEFLNDVDESASTKALVKYAPTTSDTNSSKKGSDGRVLNVVRIPRTKPANRVDSSKLAVAIPTQTFVDGGGRNKPLWNNVSDTRIELSPARKTKKDVFKKKKIQTATLYPSRVNKKQIKKLTLQTVQKEPISSTVSAIESNQQQRKSPIEHISSPVINRKVTLVNRSRSAETRQQQKSSPSRSPSRRAQTQRNYSSDRSELDRSIDESFYSEGRSPIRRSILKRGDNNRSMFEFAEERPSSSMFRPILKPNEQRTSRPTIKSRNFLTRIDMIRNENDMIRKKYENLAYHQHLVEKFSENSRIRRPYEECYAKIDDNEIEKLEKQELYYNKVYKPLRHGTLDQLRRVVNYADKFADYNEKTSITKIGESEFNDFELFEMLSKEIFGECLNEVCDELDLINSEITSNLMNGEFATAENNGDLSRRLLSLSSMTRSSTQTQSPTRTSVSTRQQQHQTPKDRSSINSNYDDESFISTTES